MDALVERAFKKNIEKIMDLQELIMENSTIRFIISILRNKKTILAAFILLNLFGLFEFILYKEAYLATGKTYYYQLLILKTILLTVYVAFSFFVLKKTGIVIYIMSLILILHGIHGVIVSLIIDWDQYFYKSFIFVLSIYFIWGSIVVYKTRNI